MPCQRLCPPYGAVLKPCYPCTRFSSATAIRSNVAFMRRLSASCCSHTSSIVAPEGLRERIPIERDNHTHTTINAMNGTHEIMRLTTQCVSSIHASHDAPSSFSREPHAAQVLRSLF